MPAFEPVTVDPPLVHDVSGEYGGKLSWSESSELPSFNNLIENTAASANLAPLIYDFLVSYDRTEWKTAPSLAHKWEYSDDGLEWTFHLRKGVKFSDGDPMDADDVVFSFSAAFHPNIECSAKSLFQASDGSLPKIEKVDAHTVKFVLTEPNALFINSVGAVEIYPVHKLGHSLESDPPTFAEQLKTSGDLADVVGTGPFRPVEYSGGQSIRYERNPYHWRTDRDGKRLPYVDQVVVGIVADINTQHEQFLAGKYDLLPVIQAPQVKRFREAAKTSGFEVQRLGVALSTAHLTVNLDPRKDANGKPFVDPDKFEVFNDVRFRRALSHATDRKKLVKLFLDGKGEPVYGTTTRGNKQWFAEHTTYPYDPAKAKALLAEMGMRDTDGDGKLENPKGGKFDIELMTNVQNAVRTKVNSQIKQDWAAIGLDTSAAQVDFQELVNNLQDVRKFDVILLGWASGIPPDPLMSRNILLSSGRLHCWHPQQESPANDWERKNDELVGKMSVEPDEAKRKELWAQVLEHHATYLPQIYLYTQIDYCAYKPRVRNVKRTILRPQLHHNVYELWLSDGK